MEFNDAFSAFHGFKDKRGCCTTRSEFPDIIQVFLPGKGIQWIYSRSSPERLPDGGVTWYGFNSTHSRAMRDAIVEAKANRDRSFRGALPSNAQPC